MRVVIVDDQSLIRSGMRALLEADSGIEVVSEAGDGAMALEVVRNYRPDVVLMDIRMPVLDGIAATRRIRAEHPDTAVVILTTYDLDEYVFGAVRAGASGFLLKDGDAVDLIRAVHLAVRGDALVEPAALRRLLDRFAAHPEEAGPTPPENITAREAEILALVGKGLSNEEISGQLTIAAATTKTHIGNLMSKLGARSRAQLVVAAYESGLVRPGAASGDGI